MSDVDDDAGRIAERGRDALLARLRPAFREAAESHHGEVSLDDAQLEQLIQHAADNADALQWRRALAEVAMDELRLGLGEALEHPAVVRAHEIVGAPSYEDAVAGLGLAPRKEASEQAEEASEQAEEASEQAEEASVQAEAAAMRAEETSEQPAETSAQAEDEPRPPLQLVCTHLGGIADLGSPEPGVELWFSEDGLDIIRSTTEPLGRLRWDELRSIEVVGARGRFTLRRTPHTYLVIRGAQGDASFEVPDSSATELRSRLSDLAGQNVPII